VPEHPLRDGSVTATGCVICAAPLSGRADQQFCSPACRQTAHRRRTSPTTVAPVSAAAVPAGRGRRAQTVYACANCDQRFAGEQWCPDCQRPCRRLDYGGACPSCGEPVTITELIKASMP